jgi:hypothetical protein
MERPTICAIGPCWETEEGRLNTVKTSDGRYVLVIGTAPIRIGARLPEHSRNGVRLGAYPDLATLRRDWFKIADDYLFNCGFGSEATAEGIQSAWFDDWG